MLKEQLKKGLNRKRSGVAGDSGFEKGGRQCFFLLAGLDFTLVKH